MENQLQTTTPSSSQIIYSTSPSEPTTPKLQSLIKSSKTLALIFNSQCPISYYKSGEQRAFIKANVVESLALMLSLLNIGKNMDGRQVEATCELIVSEPEFRLLNPAEIREAFSRGVRGNYGKIYDSVDVSIVFAWLRTYIEERFAEIERFREIEISQLRADMSKPLLALEGLDVSKLLPDPREEKQPHTPAPRKRTEAEIELDGYIAEFEELVKATEQTSAIKFVEYAGEFRDVSDYCNKRYEEARV